MTADIITVQQFLETLRRDKKARQELLDILKPDLFVKRDELNDLLTELKTQREEWNKRFEAMDKRFESMQEQMDKRFESMQEQMDKRFESMQEQMDKRFESMQEQMDKRFETVLHEIKELKVAVGSISRRAGLGIEHTILEILNEVLVEEGLGKDDIKKIEAFSLRDTEGLLMTKNAKIKFDGLLRDGRTILFEIKFRASVADVLHFKRKAEMFQHYEGITPELWLVSVELGSDALLEAKTLGMRVVYSRFVDDEH